MSFEIIHSPLMPSTSFISCAKQHNAQSETTQVIQAPDRYRGFTFVRISMTSTFRQVREKPILVAVVVRHSPARQPSEFLVPDAGPDHRASGPLEFPAVFVISNR